MKGLSIKWGSSVLVTGYGHNIFSRTVNSRDAMSHLLRVSSKTLVAFAPVLLNLHSKMCCTR